jgi:hypothetical protein
MTAENQVSRYPFWDVETFEYFLDRLHREWNNDPERSHSYADAIKSQVLQLVVDGHPDAATYAKKVLEIDSWHDVQRWAA